MDTQEWRGLIRRMHDLHDETNASNAANGQRKQDAFGHSLAVAGHTRQ